MQCKIQCNYRLIVTILEDTADITFILEQYAIHNYLAYDFDNPNIINTNRAWFLHKNTTGKASKLQCIIIIM